MDDAYSKISNHASISNEKDAHCIWEVQNNSTNWNNVNYDFWILRPKPLQNEVWY